jgi:hypothetical protein
MANETNALANFYQVEVDERFMQTGPAPVVLRPGPRRKPGARRKPAGRGVRRTRR